VLGFDASWAMVSKCFMFIFQPAGNNDPRWLSTFLDNGPICYRLSWVGNLPQGGKASVRSKIASRRSRGFVMQFDSRSWEFTSNLITMPDLDRIGWMIINDCSMCRKQNMFSWWKERSSCSKLVMKYGQIPLTSQRDLCWADFPNLIGKF